MKQKRILMKIKLGICVVLLGSLILLSGCAKRQEELLTLDVFAGRANYHGMQEGWYAKIVKDKFNLELNIIAPNVFRSGNLLFESRLSAGKVGDIVITSYENIEQCVEAGILVDLTPYLQDTTYVKEYMDVIKLINERLGYTDKIYIIPTSMSKMSPTEPLLYGSAPELGSFMPWSYYKELGCPVIENEEDLLEVLSQMQKNHPYTEDGDKVYAFSLYQDWDTGHMSLASNMVRSFGYTDTTHSIFTSADLNKTQRLIEDNSVYYRILHLYFEANQRGLLDPESGVQNFKTMYKKAQKNQVLYLWWAWMPGNYDKDSLERYVFIPVSTDPVVCEGFRKYGDGYSYAVGKDAKDIKRVIRFLDWMASPEGMMCYSSGLENVGYIYDDNGKPTLTPFSNDAWKYGYVLEQEYGGGIYSEGYCQINDSIVEKKDINPKTGEPYHSENWSSTIEGNKWAVREWSDHFGTDSPAEYLMQNNLLDVIIKTDYVAEKESEELTFIRQKCSDLIREYSWKMVFADSEAQFRKYWSTLKKLLYQNGYEKEEAADMKIIEEMRRHRTRFLEEIEN